jgi:hypothetical protein
MNNKQSFSLRAEKTGTFKDDLRVMIAGTLFCIFMIFMQPFIFKVYDYYWADRPFVTATVQVVGVSGSDIPLIKYDADATQNVTGKWIASIHYEDGSRITSRRGDGSYHSRTDDPKLWTWAAFFDNEQNIDSPEVPNRPFKVCVRYDVEARDSGVDDQTEKFCSDVFDPANPYLEIPELNERGF